MNKKRTHPARTFLRERGTSLRRLGMLTLALALASTLAACQDPAPPGTPLPSETIPAESSLTPEITAIEATPTPLPSSTPEPTPTFDISTVEDWGVGRLIFDLEEHSFGEKISLGIYALDLREETLAEILPGAELLDMAPDRQRVLFAAEEELGVYNLVTGSRQVLAEDYYALSPSGAKWDPAENRVYYLAERESGITLHWVHPDSGKGEQLASDSPIAVLEADQGVVVLGKGSCNPFGNCTISELKWTTTDGQQITAIEAEDAISLPCQRTNAYLYADKKPNESLSLHILPTGQDEATKFWSWGASEYSDCDWSPDGDQLAVTLVSRDIYSGVIIEYFSQILIPDTKQIKDLPLKAPLDHVDWSPDGKYLAFTGTVLNQDNYQIQITLMNLDSLTVRRFNQLSQLRSSSYLTIPNLFWAP